MADTTTLGQRLRQRRTDLGLTLAEVSTSARLSLPYVSNLERGRGNPTLDALTALAVALSVSLDALVGTGDVNLMELAVAEAPESLRKFIRTPTFKARVKALAETNGQTEDEMFERVVISMSSAPRRSAGDPTEDDWKRLLDAYALIIG